MPEQKRPAASPLPLQFKRRAPLAWVGQAFLILLGVGAIYLIASKAWKEPLLLVQNVIDGLKLGFVYASSRWATRWCTAS